MRDIEVGVRDARGAGERAARASGPPPEGLGPQGGFEVRGSYLVIEFTRSIGALCGVFALGDALQPATSSAFALDTRLERR
jgi:hypothetical protein